MFSQFDTIRQVGGTTPPTLRVVWVDRPRGLIAVKDADDAKAMPELRDYAEGVDLVTAGHWLVEAGQRPVFKEDALPQDDPRIQRRDASWAIVQDMVENHTGSLFVKKARCRLVAEAAKLGDVSERTVKNLLQRLFHRGMVKGALIPDWVQCGAKGVDRVPKEGSPVTGRPRRYGNSPGVPITAGIRRMFLIAADVYETNRKLDLKQAYHLFVRMFFIEEMERLSLEHDGKIPMNAFEKAGLPTYDQFRYHVRKDRDRLESDRRRLGDRVYALRHRAIVGNSTSEAWGPCARFQIDATIIDVYLRSRKSRRRVVGRATLYVVIDVFSRMIVGFSVTMEAPSWVGAMMALANAVTDKVAFCAKFGITIAPEDWPCNHICSILEGDRGEIESANIHHAIVRFIPSVENAAAHRADWKGIVESRFRILQRAFKPYVDGYIDCDYRQRGGTDYRLDACLDIEDLTRIIIRNILHFNNYHVLKKYPRHPGMTEDGVPSVPREMWRWGIANLSGLPRAPREDVFRFALLPTAEASVTREGIYFQGAFYVSPQAMQRKWFEKARKGRFKVRISYDKRSVDEIYVHDDASDTGFHVATLNQASRRYAGLNFWELHELTREEKNINADAREAEVISAANTMHDGNKDVEAARAAVESAPDPRSAAQQVAGIRDEHEVEKQSDRVLEVADYRAGMRSEPPTTGGATIHTIPTIETARRPSLRERLAAQKEKSC